ncbi:MAG: beta-glucosidase, partial [Planctomyces sp.]|nr:beta-glucosidase [Planctomyces sp.]
LGAERVRYSADAKGVNPADVDAVIAVIGETPYAEGNGDIPPSGTLQHSSRHPEDLAVLRAAAALGKPVITVFMSGRPLWVNDLLNLSDAFVAAWLPGSEGGGVADLLLRGPDGRIAHEFRGRLPFSWPREACQTPLNAGDGQTPLFPLGHGLGAAQAGASLGRLAETLPAGGCEARSEVSIFARTAQPPYELLVASPTQAWPTRKISDDLNATLTFPSEAQPALTMSTVQLNTQQDAKLLRWQGPAQLLAWSAQKAALSVFPDAALVFDLQLHTAPRGPVTLAMEQAKLELTPLLRGMALGEKRRIVIPLACFAARGVDLARVEIPFALGADAPFAAAVAQVRVQTGAATSPDAVDCAR